MNRIKNALRSSFLTAFILSFAFAGGIPAIVLGAINGLHAVMGVGIACTVIGFYGTPIAWISYGSKRSLHRLVAAVYEEHIYTVKELSAQLSVPEANVRSQIATCINKRYLPGFIRNGDSLVLNENSALSETEHAAECPHCGAKFKYKGANATCPYCGTLIERK